MAAITFTLDLEDHRPDATAPVRYPDATRRMLDHLSARGITGTFFVVGEVAAAEPDLVRAVSSAGHEIALHGWTHTPLVELDEASLARDLRRGKSLLEELTGTEVLGFRAPTFSLIASTTWATGVLADCGFAYSSSVLPAANPLYGFPGAPTHPFLWPTGVAEFPVPLAGVGPLRVPYLGGTYLRVLPGWLTRRLARRAGGATGTGAVPWTYLHPYDVDTEEPYWRVPDAGRLSPLLWVGRGRVAGKLDALYAGGSPAGPPLRERLAEARRGGIYHPQVDTASTAHGPEEPAT